MSHIKESSHVVARGRVEPARGFGPAPPLTAKLRARRRGGGSGWGGGGYWGGGAFAVSKTTVGLWVFMGVVTVLFSIIASTYIARMKSWDWHPLPEPQLLWLNTGVLILSSAAMQWARIAVRRGQVDGVWIGLIAGGICAWAFLGGQLWAWRELGTLGYFVASNPASSFFYLITALHGLHLFGGLLAGGVTAVRLWRDHELAEVRLSVELCALYWHFLLVVWVVLFGLMLLT